jgi:hypothetical protein
MIPAWSKYHAKNPNNSKAYRFDNIVNNSTLYALPMPESLEQSLCQELFPEPGIVPYRRKSMVVKDLWRIVVSRYWLYVYGQTTQTTQIAGGGPLTNSLQNP